MDEKITKIEKLANEIEKEKDFDKSVEKFIEAAGLVKDALIEGARQKGKVFEIIKEIDKFVECELKLDDKDDEDGEDDDNEEDC